MAEYPMILAKLVQCASWGACPTIGGQPLGLADEAVNIRWLGLSIVDERPRRAEKRTLAGRFL
jgi:hypothetical protein